MATSAPPAAGAGLRRDAVGLREVLFQSITDMAPGAAIAASIPAGVAFAGGALPLSVVLALVACLFSAWSIGLLAKELPSSGSMATYAARGLHPSIGFLVAWAYAMVGWLIPPLVLLQLGFTTAATLHAEISGYPLNLWWPWSILGLLIILAAGYFGVRTSARLGTILGVFEIAVFLIMGVLLVIHAGGHNTGAVFTTKYTPHGFHGLNGVVAGSVFSVLAFGGFEGAAPLAEEARNPGRTIRLAVLLATLSIGALYVFTTYAIDVSFGPARFLNFTTGTGSASWEGVARSLYGLFWVLVFLAIVNSTLANSNAGVNVSSRTAFAMGRIRAFPPVLGRVSERHRSPVPAIVLGGVISLIVMLWLGIHYDPETAFAMVGTGLVIMIVAVYILMNAACIGYFVRSPQHKTNVISHVLVPILGIAAFVPAWCAGAGVKIGLSFISPLPKPLSYMGPAVAVWMVIGLIYLIYLYMRDRQRVVDVGLVHIDLDPELAADDPRVAT